MLKLLSPKGQVTGSSPVGVTICLYYNQYVKPDHSLRLIWKYGSFAIYKSYTKMSVKMAIILIYSNKFDTAGGEADDVHREGLRGLKGGRSDRPVPA